MPLRRLAPAQPSATWRRRATPARVSVECPSRPLWRRRRYQTILSFVFKSVPGSQEPRSTVPHKLNLKLILKISRTVVERDIASPLDRRRTNMGAIVFGLALSLALTVGAGRASAQSCAGDCDGDGSVSIGDLVSGVNLALGSGGDCDAVDTNTDGEVSISELVTAVTNALDGCTPVGPATRAGVVERYAALLYANYGDVLTGATALRTAIDAFVAAPSAAGLQAAKDAWLASRPAYLQTEMARFYDGPIDNAATGPEGFINAWPLDEAYIDYVVGSADAGIINAPDLYPAITPEVLVELNEGESETTIASGYHAIEFLLWGQDLSDTGPGNRPFNDYVTGSSGTASNQARRGDYLRAAAKLLLDDLTLVRDQWEPGVEGNYRAAFVALNADEALRRLLTGMGTMSGGELTGQRLSVAFDTKDQEDEHSCFSDNTHVDHRNDEIGIQNAFLGRYGGVTGPGIYDLVKAVDPTLADATRNVMDEALTAIFAIPVPFDQAIQGPDSSPGRVAIAAAIAKLNQQTDKIALSAEALGISISTTSP
ncbi:MAG: imelysin family protein [bacterium]